jgi:hypothetical protein
MVKFNELSLRGSKLSGDVAASSKRGRRHLKRLHGAASVDFDHAIEHVASRIGLPFNKNRHCRQQPPGAFPIDRREDNEAGMQFLPADQPAEIARIIGDKNAVLFDTAAQNDVVGLTASSDIERMKRVDIPVIEAARELRREAFVTPTLLRPTERKS